MCLRILWRDADGLANPGYGLPGSSCLQVEKAQQVTGINIARHELEQAQVELLGLGNLTGLMRPVRLLQKAVCRCRVVVLVHLNNL